MPDHDRLFKELIQTFFEEFMLLFFPQAYETIDFSEAKFLSEEVFTDVTVGEKKVVDLLVETKLRGEEGLIIVHVEPQSYKQPLFNERMFVYFSRLYEKYRRRILPIAIFSHDQTKDEASKFHLGFPFLEVLTFNYFTVELRKKQWRDYIRQDNPVAAALISKMGYAPEERIEVKMEFLRMMVRLELDPARMQLITGFFETYLTLNLEEEEILKREIQNINPQEEVRIMELMSSWEKKGRAEGKVEGKQEVAKNMLRKGLDETLIEEVTGLSKVEIEKIKRQIS
jgi:hypothetical protein